MHCTVCHTPLQPDASICPTCGVRTVGSGRDGTVPSAPSGPAAYPMPHGPTIHSAGEGADVAEEASDVDVLLVTAGILAIVGGFLQMLMLVFPYLQGGERLFDSRGTVVLNVMTGGWVLACGIAALLPLRDGNLARAALAALLAPAAGQAFGVLIGLWREAGEMGPGLFFDVLSSMVDLTAIVVALLWLLPRESRGEEAGGRGANAASVALAALGSLMVLAGANMDWSRLTLGFGTTEGCCSPFDAPVDGANAAAVFLTALVTAGCVLAVGLTRTSWAALGLACGAATAALVPLVSHLVTIAELPDVDDIAPAAGFFVLVFGVGLTALSVAFRFVRISQAQSGPVTETPVNAATVPSGPMPTAQTDGGEDETEVAQAVRRSRPWR